MTPIRNRISNGGSSRADRVVRARKIVAYIKKTYSKPKSELNYTTPFQFVVAVMLSAQCTDKAVNKLTAALFKKYKTPKDFAKADSAMFTKEISSIPFFNNKAKAIIGAAKEIQTRQQLPSELHLDSNSRSAPLESQRGGVVPRTEKELVELPGIGYKTAHVILGELYDIWNGIATDTHVKRFAKKFDLTDQNDLMKISKDLEALIPKKDWKYVNNGLVLYGRYVCKARPHDCVSHPLTKLWLYAAIRWPKAK